MVMFKHFHKRAWLSSAQLKSESTPKKYIKKNIEQ